MILPFFILAQSLAPAPAPAPAAAAAPAPESAPAPAAAPAPASFRLALTSTSAFGVTHARFFNQLVGGRLDYRFTSRFALGAAVAYANLKGKDRRVHNVLPEVMVEYRVPLDGERFGLPLRFTNGFLPMNGPTLRVSVGLDFSLSSELSLEILPLEPMVWVNRERPEVSLNASLGLRLAL